MTGPSIGETVLLVEDDAQVRQILARVLQKAKFAVLVAANGADALTLARKHYHRGDVVVVDMRLPGLSCADLVEILRSEHPGMRTICISGLDEERAFEQGGPAHYHDFLRKPFNNAALVSSVVRALSSDATPTRPANVGSGRGWIG